VPHTAWEARLSLPVGLGEGGIRTLETFITFCGFQDRRIQPLCHLSTFLADNISLGFSPDRYHPMLPVVALWLHLVRATALGEAHFAPTALVAWTAVGSCVRLRLPRGKDREEIPSSTARPQHLPKTSCLRADSMAQSEKVMESARASVNSSS
jgi:hypothetical protein